MLRFVPDTWLEALLRPLLLADPVGGLYVEIGAPDWRFAFLFLFLFIAKLSNRSQAILTAVQWRLLVGLMLAFYLWTPVSGNGRYFIWGLVIVGPLVVAAARRLHASQAMRNTLIAGAVTLQFWVVWVAYVPNVWALRPWTQGPGVALSANSLAEQPAVFVTLGAISHSILVPQMHPLSRWTNAAGQQELAPGMREWNRRQELLASPLPKYGVVQAAKLVMTADNQPTKEAWDIMWRGFESQGLGPTSKPCTFLSVNWTSLQFEKRFRMERKSTAEVERGFWFCELKNLAPSEVKTATQSQHTQEFDDVFQQVERRCPRYFPSGYLTRPAETGPLRLYGHSDTTIFIDVSGSGVVYFKNMLALNPTKLGTVESVRQGRFQLDCDRLPGRYRAPWKRGWDVELE